MAALGYFLAAFSLASLSAAQSQIVLFPWTGNHGSPDNAVDALEGFGNSQPISQECGTALNQTVSCDARMQQLASQGYYMSLGDARETLCTAQCNSSLVSYRQSVVSACGETGAFDTYPNAWRGDLIRDYFDLVCATDLSGVDCPQWLEAQFEAAGNPGILDLPTSALCSPCHLSYLRTVQRSAFLGYNDALTSTYTEVGRRCNAPDLGSGAANIPPEDKFPDHIGRPSVNTTCISGNTYTVQQGDTCHSIALAQSVSQGTLWAINNLLPDCSGLRAGETICLPQTCQTTDIDSPTEDCWTIWEQTNVTMLELQAYNPTINADCSNLGNASFVACISSPEGTYEPPEPPIDGGDWSLGDYAKEIVEAPGPVPFGTTKACGAYVQVQVGDICTRISLANKVSASLFMEINPSIDAECSNLVPGLWYCTHPTPFWNDPGNVGNTTSTTQPAPAPTPPGTTPACYRWHVVVAGDTCAHLQATQGASLTELLAWNTDLLADCSNLMLGIAYCVSGPPVPVSTTSTVGSPTPTPPMSTSAAPTATPTGVTCVQTYTVVAGDWCSKIWDQFGLSEAEFRALNPSLNANCDLDIGQVVCVGSSTGGNPSPTTSSSAPTPTGGNSCVETYTVVSGDWCSKIWGQFGLSEAQFRELNPTLNANCDLNIGQVVCVRAAAAPVCNHTYTVVSGDWCSKIWAQFGLSEAQFRGLNPGLNSSCDLNIGQVLCVG